MIEVLLLERVSVHQTHDQSIQTVERQEYNRPKLQIRQESAGREMCSSGLADSWPRCRS